MSQSNAGDFPIDPQVTSGTALAEILNRFYNATNTQNSGATEPPTTYPGMFWYDSSVTPPVLKIRNAGNSGWIDFVDSLAIGPGDITGLGTMAGVNSPAPVANGGTGATTAPQALVNLGADARYVKKTGDTMTGALTAPQFAIDGDTSFYQDANNVYLHFNPSRYLYEAIGSGALAYQGPAGLTTIHGASGDFTAPANVWAGSGNMGMVTSDGARRYLRFATDGWRLEWMTANGDLQFTSAAGGLLWRASGGGAVYAASASSALYHSSRGTGNTAFLAEGYSDWGGGVLGRTILEANPGWNQILIQALHAQGQWAGIRFWSPTGTVDFKMSGNPVTIEGARIANASYADTAGSANALNGRPWNQFIHQNGYGNPESIHNSGSAYLVAYIGGFGEVGWSVSPSDERLKQQIAATKLDSLNIISKLNFVEYRFKPIPSTIPGEPDFMIDDGRLHPLGLVAQQAKDWDGALVSEIGTYMQLVPQELAMLALHGVQQLLARVAALEAAP